MARTKVNANDLKLRRLEQNNDRLLHDLRRRRMTVSIASIE
jgi:hypothetical protein